MLPRLLHRLTTEQHHQALTVEPAHCGAPAGRLVRHGAQPLTQVDLRGSNNRDAIAFPILGQRRRTAGRCQPQQGKQSIEPSQTRGCRPGRRSAAIAAMSGKRSIRSGCIVSGPRIVPSESAIGLGVARGRALLHHQAPPARHVPQHEVSAGAGLNQWKSHGSLPCGEPRR